VIELFDANGAPLHQGFENKTEEVVMSSPVTDFMTAENEMVPPIVHNVWKGLLAGAGWEYSEPEKAFKDIRRKGATYRMVYGADTSGGIHVVLIEPTWGVCDEMFHPTRHHIFIPEGPADGGGYDDQLTFPLPLPSTVGVKQSGVYASFKEVLNMLAKLPYVPRSGAEDAALWQLSAYRAIKTFEHTVSARYDATIEPGADLRPSGIGVSMQFVHPQSGYKGALRAKVVGNTIVFDAAYPYNDIHAPIRWVQMTHDMDPRFEDEEIYDILNSFEIILGEYLPRQTEK